MNMWKMLPAYLHVVLAGKETVLTWKEEKKNPERCFLYGRNKKGGTAVSE